MADQTMSTVVATLIGRGATAAQAVGVAEEWGLACNHDWNVINKWLASTTIVSRPSVQTKVRPAGTTIQEKKGHQ